MDRTGDGVRPVSVLLRDRREFNATGETKDVRAVPNQQQQQQQQPLQWILHQCPG